MFNNIILPVDNGSDANEVAAAKAVELAELCDGDIHVVHVTRAEDKRWTTGDKNEELHAIKQMKAFFEDQPCKDRVDYITTNGSPATRICELVDELDANVIVMATHARSGLSRVTIGSITEDVIRNAACPVLTMTSPIEE